MVPGRATITDSEISGLQIRGTRHKAQWSLRVRLKGTRSRIDLGDYPALTPDMARDAARVWLARQATGQDVKKALDAQRAQTAGLSVGDLFDRHADMSGLKTAVKVRQNMRRTYAAFLSRPVQSLSVQDWMKPIGALEARAPTSAANRLREIKSILSWASQPQRGWCENVLAGVKAAQAPQREHDPSTDDMRSIYTAAGTLGAPFGPLLQILILTAMRRTETSRMRWEDLDLSKGIWTVPSSEAKNGKSMVVPLSGPAVAILQELGPRDAGFVFTTTDGAKPVSGFGRAAQRLVKAAGAGVEPFQWHDFRRGFATAMAGAGYPDALVDRCLNHTASSTSTTVSRIYNKSDRLTERREIMTAWAEMLA